MKEFLVAVKIIREVEDIDAESAREKVVYEIKNNLIDWKDVEIIVYQNTK